MFETTTQTQESITTETTAMEQPTVEAYYGEPTVVEAVEPTPELTPTEQVLEDIATFTKVIKSLGKKVAQLKETREELAALNTELLSIAGGNEPTDPSRDVYTVASEHKKVSAKENKLSKDVSEDVIPTAIDTLMASLETYKATY